MTPQSSKQLTLSLEPGILQRFPKLRQCLQWTVLNSANGFKAVASDVDLSSSELSRRLNPSPGDPRSLDVDKMVEIIEATGDLTPVYWLIAKFLPDDATREEDAVRSLERMLPDIGRLLADIKRRKK